MQIGDSRINCRCQPSLLNRPHRTVPASEAAHRAPTRMDQLAIRFTEKLTIMLEPKMVNVIPYATWTLCRTLLATPNIRRRPAATGKLSSIFPVQPIRL